MPKDYRFERALFLLGNSDSGKSHQIRYMFSDVRFGRKGRPLPKSTKKVGVVKLSNERMLYVRITSPQEANVGNKGRESVDDFFKKIEDFIALHGPDARWNIVCPMQPGVRGNNPKMVGGIRLIQKFIDVYRPERVRVAVLNPPYWGTPMAQDDLNSVIDQIRNLKKIDVIEPMILDASGDNGLLLPDFFDFT